MRAENPDIPVVVITGQATIDSAMEAIKGGAYDYLAKPPQLQMLGALLRRAIEKKHMAEEVRHLQREILKRSRAEDIVGKSPQMLEVYKTLQRVAESRTSVLVLGESGTGKELVARKLHERSPRRAEHFVPVNVSAIPEGLLESELFGHVRGAFTGALTTRRGLFDEAHRGTLFLDEIGDLSLPLQAKLLRVIQEHRIKPVGGNEEHEVDVRLVCATHRDLDAMVKRGHVPRGPLLPAQRGLHRPAAPARAARGHPAARAALPAQVRAGDRPDGPGRVAGGRADARDLRLARQRARVGERRRARGAPVHPRRHHAGRAPGEAARAPARSGRHRGPAPTCARWTR